MSNIRDKFIPSELTVGNEFTKEDLDKIFGTSEIVNILGGIGKVKNCLLLLMTLDKTYTAELPNIRDKMTRQELSEHSYPHLDYFDMDGKVFRWDGPTNMDLESPLISSFVSKICPCLLFIREYFHKNKEEEKNNITNDKYFYCGQIKYIKHHDTKVLHFISSVEDKPNEKLKHLYNFKPLGLEERIKEFNHLEEKEKNDFKDLLKDEESRTHERKSTFSGGKGSHMPVMTQKCLKAVAGFLNEKGGNLMIGIQDGGEITGIERDFMYKNQDQFNVYILTQMRNYIDRFETIQKYISIKFRSFAFDTTLPYLNNENKVAHKKVKNKLVCQINCRPLPAEIVAYIRGKLCARVGPQTIELTAQEAVSWVEDRKKDLS